MWTILCFVAGLLIGLSALAFFRLGWIKRHRTLIEQKTQLSQEKKIAVEFMHNLAEAIGEGIDRKVLYQRIIHTAVISTGAMSASIYEKLPNGRLKGVAVEGLFPPQRAIKTNPDEDGAPSASFIV